MTNPGTNNDYKLLYEAAQKENDILGLKLQQLQHEIQQLKKMIFGSRQEKFVSAINPPEQLLLNITAEPSEYCSNKGTKN